jgi:hypothetical protein
LDNHVTTTVGNLAPVPAEAQTTLAACLQPDGEALKGEDLAAFSALLGELKRCKVRSYGDSTVASVPVLPTIDQAALEAALSRPAVAEYLAEQLLGRCTAITPGGSATA